MNRKLWKVALGLILFVGGCSTKTTSSKQSDKFEAKLDTDKTVNLKISGFLGNFEALDQIVNEFNEYYPNVVISYEANGSDQLREYVQNNDVDIFMTADRNFRYPDLEEKYVGDYCLDLNSEDLDLNAVEQSYLENCTIDGKLYSLPLGKNVMGMAVNETLLEKEGFDVPADYASFIKVLDGLCEKGYVPIQGASSSVASYLLDSVVMTKLGTDASLLKDVKEGKPSASDTLVKDFQILEDFQEKGYFKTEVNQEYPDDNYDGAIMKFFEGNVPFWMCSSENFSGTKKRESKSESFEKNSFTYSFMNVPLSDDGVYNYSEAWYGFSVNKDSENADYALEFVRYLAREDSLNEIAELKGIPSVTKKNSDVRYEAIQKPEKVAESYANTGVIEKYMHDALKEVASGYLNGDIKSVSESAKLFVQKCASIAK